MQNRPCICVYCGDYGSNYEEVVNNHWPVCPEIIVSCLFDCGVDVPRKNFNAHVTLCGQTEVNCDFEQFGCEEKILRKLLKTHNQDSMAHHIVLVVNSYSKMKVEVDVQNIIIEDLSKLMIMS